MTRPLILSDEAIQDLEQACDWYDKQRAGLGNRFALGVTSTLDAIAFSPSSYGIVWRHVRASLVRSFPCVIYFRELPSRVEVIAIIHGKRNPDDWKSRA